MPKKGENMIFFQNPFTFLHYTPNASKKINMGKIYEIHCQGVPDSYMKWLLSKRLKFKKLEILNKNNITKANILIDNISPTSGNAK